MYAKYIYYKMLLLAATTNYVQIILMNFDGFFFITICQESESELPKIQTKISHILILNKKKMQPITPHSLDLSAQN